MIKTIIIAMITYIATSIDEIPVLFMLYKREAQKGKAGTVTFSYFAGTFLITAMSILAAMGLAQIPEKWIIGLIGLIPLVMGIKILLTGEDDDEEEKAIGSARKIKLYWLQVFIITIALGADDFGVYIPLFTTLTAMEILQMLCVFFAGTAAICFAGFQLTKIEEITRFIEKYERFICGIIFSGIGIFVIAECGTFIKIFSLIKV